MNYQIKAFIRDYWKQIISALVVLFLFLFLLTHVSGCTSLSKPPAATATLDNRIPATQEEAKIMAYYREQIKEQENKTLQVQADIENQKRFNKVSLACLAGMILCSVAIFYGVWRKVAIAVFAGCAVGICLAWLNIKFPIPLAIGGGLIGLAIGGYAVYLWKKSLVATVTANDIVKTQVSEIPDAQLNSAIVKQIFSTVQNEVQQSTDTVKSAVTKVIDTIRGS